MDNSGRGANTHVHRNDTGRVPAITGGNGMAASHHISLEQQAGKLILVLTGENSQYAAAGS